MKNQLDKYIKDRYEAMMAYPDITKLEKLIEKYSDLFYPNILLWREKSPLVKLMTLEYMILNWTGAPAELVAKVNEAREKRKSS